MLCRSGRRPREANYYSGRCCGSLVYIFEFEIAIEPAYIAIAGVHVGAGLVLMATVIVRNQGLLYSRRRRGAIYTSMKNHSCTS
jgi:hypothetical protein